MDIFTTLSADSDYSAMQLQVILGAWVLAAPLERKSKVQSTGHVEEDDYDKQSIYSLLYSLYRSVGMVSDGNGARYEFTFNTWGYAWPKAWGPSPIAASDPQRFGRNAYTGLYHFDAVRELVRSRAGRVHVLEMGCGTGAGAHHVCKNVLPDCTYQAVDMQRAAIATCRRKFVPELGGRLVATHADATQVAVEADSADIVAVCETHVTEMPGQVTAEDARFFATAYRALKPGGFLVWGNAIPEATWKPCFELLESIGMRPVEICDVTEEAIAARDQDKRRVQAYVDACLAKFHGFRIPVLGRRKEVEARMAMKNFYRDPGTNLYDTMVNRTDTYKVVCFQKPEASA
jgi:SAM-dependent methyltransferase